ncbi:hypothetical protein [Methanosarcina sp.]|nr:hypothetical protein [Methanosarcina sp.]
MKGFKVLLLDTQKLNLQDTFQAAGVWSPRNGGQITGLSNCTSVN